MNKQRRIDLKDAIRCMESAKYIIKDVKSKEEDAFDNLPENLQCSNRGCDMEENIDEMDEVLDKLDDIIDQVNDIIFC